MYLVWRYLARRGIRYSMVTGTNNEHQGVQLFHDAYQDKVANCVDGSVMLASIYGRLGLPCSLVLVPGHCFLQVFVGDDPVYVETTLLGATIDSQPPEERLQSFHESLRGDPELRSFSMALHAGWNKFEDSWKEAKDAADHFNARFAAWEQNSTPETFQAVEDAAKAVKNYLKLVPISWARKNLGVEPIGAPANLSKAPPP